MKININLYFKDLFDEVSLHLEAVKYYLNFSSFWRKRILRSSKFSYTKYSIEYNSFLNITVPEVDH